MSTIKVNKIENTATSNGGIEIDNTGHVKLDSVQMHTAGSPSNRNLVINGDMRIAQRGTSSTSNGGFTCDRFKHWHANVDENLTYNQHVLTSSDTGPWEEGFRYSFMTTNGNQTSGAGTHDYIQEEYNFEGQDIAQSGWDYNSSSSYVTLSFWIKSSVSQKFTFTVLCRNGTDQAYLMETDTLTANTWTKIERAIPGNSNITMDNDTNNGLSLIWWPFIGSNYTSGSANTWYEHGTTKWSLVSDDTWYTTNDATLEYTGVQLELGEKATPFEHRCYSDEFRRCQRYYYQIDNPDGDDNPICMGLAVTGHTCSAHITFPTAMREAPTSLTSTGTASDYNLRSASGSGDATGAPSFADATKYAAAFGIIRQDSLSAGDAVLVRLNNSNAFIGFNSEI